MSSTPASTLLADRNDLKSSIGLVTRLMAALLAPLKGGVASLYKRQEAMPTNHSVSPQLQQITIWYVGLGSTPIGGKAASSPG